MYNFDMKCVFIPDHMINFVLEHTSFKLLLPILNIK
jgi:hypothetical protein